VPILTGPEIVRIVESSRNSPETLPFLKIDPFDPELAGPNSYDIHLGNSVSWYVLTPMQDPCFGGGFIDGIDSRNPEVSRIRIPDTGFLLRPGILYLGSTEEWIECQGLVPYIDGRSSVGRLGIQIHLTAGRGDDGWRGQFTLEITCVHPVMIYPGMRIGQLTFHTLQGERKPYKGRYADSSGPVASRMYSE